MQSWGPAKILWRAVELDTIFKGTERTTSEERWMAWVAVAIKLVHITVSPWGLCEFLDRIIVGLELIQVRWLTVC